MKTGGTIQTWRTRPNWVVFSVSGSRGCWGNTPDVKNTTTWSQSSCLGSRGCRESGRDTPDTKNATVGSRFQVWGVSNIPDTKDATLWSHSLCLGSRRGRDIPDTKKATMWSRPSCLGGGRMGREGAGTPQTRRTRPHGRVLCVWVVESGGLGAVAG